MTSLYLSDALHNASSLEQVVKIVNEGTCEGMQVSGGINFGSEQLAGQYAARAAHEAGYTDTASLEAHLEILHDAGAHFSWPTALIHSKAVVAALLAEG